VIADVNLDVAGTGINGVVYLFADDGSRTVEGGSSG